MAALRLDGVRVFDGDRLSEPRSIAIVDGLIAAAAPADAETMDARGAALLPGLIDGHVHIDAADQAATLAHWGVTTALDMAAKDVTLVPSLRGTPRVADLRSAGSPAGPPDGTHIRRLGYAPAIGISAPEEAEAWVAARAAEGSDYIKVLLEPAIPGQPAPLEEATAAAIVSAAHAAGLKVIAHTTTPGSVALGVAAGVDAVTHTPLGAELTEDFGRDVAAAGVVSIPTLSMMRAIALNMPAAMRPPGMDFANAVASLGALHRAGVTIVAGTDANANPATPARPPHGESLHDELELMVSAGLSPAEALRAATVNAAAFFGLEDRGRVEPGLRADLILVDGDPTADVSATRGLRAVWVGGERVR